MLENIHLGILKNVLGDSIIHYSYFKTETEDHSLGKIFSEKKCGGTELFSEKTEALFAELN